MTGTAIAVSRRKSAFHCGHVAWGYSRREAGITFYSFGSVEDLKGLPVAIGELMAFWSLTAPEVRMDPALDRLRRYGYESFKSWPVEAADPEAADRTVEAQGSRPYLVIGNNCLDSVHRVLTSYGARHPHIHNPSEIRSWIPNLWFDRIPFPARPVAELERDAGGASSQRNGINSPSSA